VCAKPGIATAIYSPSGANSGVGFAVPVDVINSSVSQIIKFGKVIRPILGISFAPDQSVEQVCYPCSHMRAQCRGVFRVERCTDSIQ
jgi:S1-C subfamily serine protease